MSGRSLFKRSKIIIKVGIAIFSLFPKFISILIWDMVSSFSQLPFIGIRYLILKTMTKECGENVRIGKNVTIISWANLIIGKNVSIHSGCYIDATGSIKIGDNVSIAHNSSILSTNHQYTDETIPIKYNPVIAKRVVINDDVWIGCGCQILSGVIIEERSIIAAGAVVNKNVESNSIYGGIPARKIKTI